MYLSPIKHLIDGLFGRPCILTSGFQLRKQTVDRHKVHTPSDEKMAKKVTFGRDV